MTAAHAKPTLDPSLPDPELNPLINPRLGKNLGRWASVYYSAPPEQREDAVRNLLRELDGHQGTEPNRFALAESPEAAPKTTSALKPEEPTANFCVKCGSRLHAKKSGACEPRSSTRIVPLDQVPVVSKLADPMTQQLPTRSGFRPHVAIVLTVSLAMAGWALKFIAADLESQTLPALALPWSTSAPPAPAFATTSRSPANVTVQPKNVRPAVVQAKPPAGQPFTCRGDSLSSCTGGELRRKTLSLAASIDALYIGQNKRTNQLLQEARAKWDDPPQRRQADLRQANHSVHLWEQIRLASYQHHEKRETTRYRAELLRRLAASDAPRNRRMYEHPSSSLQLHYIAEDLRRLAARLPEPRGSRPRAKD